MRVDGRPTRGHTIAPRVAEPISREGDAATWSVRASGARASSDNLHEGTPLSAELRRCVVVT